MPSIWTHILFCENVFDTIRSPLPFSRNETFMKLGAQGPDLFRFYNFWPWIGEDEPVQQISEVLHNRESTGFLSDLIKAAKQQNGEVRAYVFGFITHQILDKHTNPYIQYQIACKGHYPQQLQVNIDTLMMEKYHNLKTWKAPVHKEIDVGFKLNKDIVYLLQDFIRKHYPEVAKEISPSCIRKSYRDMKMALRLYSDPLKWKNKLFHSLIGGRSHQPVEDDADYLNLQKSVWHNPETKQSSAESFIDLYEFARAEGVEIMTSILDYWGDENNAESRSNDRTP